MQLIEPSAIKVPERAEVRDAGMLTMFASTRHQDRSVHMNLMDVPFTDPE